MNDSRSTEADPSASAYLTAQEAAQALGVKVASIYSYVSRGIIRSVEQTGSRLRLYYREDVEAAAKRMGGRAGAQETAEAIVRWGPPLLASSITEISEAGPVYRGSPAVMLANRGDSFEAVTDLLWGQGASSRMGHWWDDALPHLDLLSELESVASDRPPSDSYRLLGLVYTAMELRQSSQAAPSDDQQSMEDARKAMVTFAAALGLFGPSRRVTRPVPGSSIASLTAESLLGSRAYDAAFTTASIDKVLVLCADHELSPPALTARVAASAGASMLACLRAAAATHSGSALAGAADRTEDLFEAAQNPGAFNRAVHFLQHSGQIVPGFNHVAYPKGDPRARYMLDMARELGSGVAAYDRFAELVAVSEETFNLKPRLELGLLAASIALGMPRRSASALWTLGRCSGWAAHVLEQRHAAFLLRARARYVEGP